MHKIIFILFLCMIHALQAKDYTQNPQTKLFIEKMHATDNLKKSYLETLFSHVEVQSSALNFFLKKPNKVITKEKQTKPIQPYQKYGTWDRYVKFKVTPSRIAQGKDFIKRNKSTFDKTEKSYGIPSEYIAAIIGIETVYGKNVGNYPVFDTLTTLAFEPNRRNAFFKNELEKFILLAYRQGFNPKNVKGSFAGAIGLCQFIPSNYEAYGVDFNGDGKIRLQQAGDAIASVANYLKRNGWRKEEEVATRVSYEGKRFTAYKTGYQNTYRREELRGIKPKVFQWNYHGRIRLIKLDRTFYDELWYGTKNFFVITRYNHSAYYAMAVHQLAMRIKLDEN